MLLDHVKFNLSHGFPDHWGTSELERRLIQNICQRKNYDLVVNATWGFFECIHPVTKGKMTKFEVTKDLVINHGAENVLFFNLVDPLYIDSTWYQVLRECSAHIGLDKITTVGFVDTKKFKQDLPVPFWAIYNSIYFENYTIEQLEPANIENMFLCYNRKPTWHRRILHKHFHKNDLMSKGIFTLGNEDPSKVILNRNPNPMPFENNGMHGDLNIPNDTLSLGPLDAWNSSFLVIVTETDHNMQTEVPFLSEKIWKPLIGMRPFVCLGDRGTISSLKEAGFYTFNEFFGAEKDDLTVSDIINIIKMYRGDPHKDYQSLRVKLVHNRERFFQYAREQQQKLGI